MAINQNTQDNEDIVSNIQPPQDSIYDYLMKKKALADSQLQATNDTVNNRQQTNDLLQGLNQMVAARSTGQSNQKFNPQFYNDQNKQIIDQGSQQRQDIRQQLEDALTARKLQTSENLQNTAEARAKAEENRKQLNFQSSQKQSARNEMLQKDSDDPNSYQSKTAVSLADKVQPGVNHSGMSYTQLNGLLPQLDSLYKTEIAIRGKHQDRADAAQVRKDAEELRRSDKDEARLNKLEMQMKDDLDPNKARGGNLAKNQAQVDQADRLQQLYTESNGDIRNLDSRQQEELAIGLNRLLSQSGQGASAQIKALVPSTAIGDAAKLKEWLVNEPEGLNQIAFVKRMAETIQRERALGLAKVREAQIQRMSAYKELQEKRPESHQAILHGYGIDYNDIDENGRYKKPIAGADKQQSDKSLSTTKPSWAH